MRRDESQKARLALQGLIAFVAVIVSTSVRAEELDRSAGDAVRSVLNLRPLSSLFPDDCGVSTAPVYYGEVFTNTRGGKSTNGATRYLGLLNVPITVDLQQAGASLPGKFHLLAQNTQGEGITRDYVGDTQVVSNLDALDNLTQVGEYWWEFEPLQNRVTVRLGKQDLNTEFLDLDSAANFINSSFGISPSACFPTYPNQSMAMVLLVKLTDSLEGKYGLWSGFADGGSWGFSSDGAPIHFAELDYSYSLRDGELPGSIEVGAAYFSSGRGFGANFPDHYGYYVQIEQLVYRESAASEQNTQGLGVFISHFPRYSDGPMPSIAIRGDLVGGMTYTGLIPSRDDDVVGFGFAFARLNAGGTDQETAVELFYNAQLTSRMSLQPDIQYIVSPSGIHSDALAVGLRMQLEL